MKKAIQITTPQPFITVLHVDTNADDRELVRHEIEGLKRGLVTSVVSIEHAERALEEGPYNVIIMDGTKENRQWAESNRERYPNRRVVFLTEDSSGELNKQLVRRHEGSLGAGLRRLVR